MYIFVHSVQATNASKGCGSDKCNAAGDLISNIETAPFLLADWYIYQINMSYITLDELHEMYLMVKRTMFVIENNNKFVV